MRCRFIGPESDLPPKIGTLGTYIGPGDQSYLTLGGETPEEKQKRLAEYAETHSMIHWDGITHPWNCRNAEFEFCE